MPDCDGSVNSESDSSMPAVERSVCELILEVILDEVLIIVPCVACTKFAASLIWGLTAEKIQFYPYILFVMGYCIVNFVLHFLYHPSKKTCCMDTPFSYGTMPIKRIAENSSATALTVRSFIFGAMLVAILSGSGDGNEKPETTLLDTYFILCMAGALSNTAQAMVHDLAYINLYSQGQCETVLERAESFSMTQMHNGFACTLFTLFLIGGAVVIHLWQTIGGLCAFQVCSLVLIPPIRASCTRGKTMRGKKKHTKSKNVSLRRYFHHKCVEGTQEQK